MSSCDCVKADTPDCGEHTILLSEEKYNLMWVGRLHFLKYQNKLNADNRLSSHRSNEQIGRLTICCEVTARMIHYTNQDVVKQYSQNS